MHECAGAPSLRSRIAVLGVLSHDEPLRAKLRAAIRETWLPEIVNAGIVTRFAVRVVGYGSSQVIQETRSHGDVLQLAVSTELEQGAGALTSLMGWLTCALYLWPSVRLIGKAEDDIFVHGAGIAAAVTRGLSHADQVGAELYWGTFESFHWSRLKHAPVMWSELAAEGTENCSHAQPSNVMVDGPFPFANRGRCSSSLCASSRACYTHQLCAPSPPLPSPPHPVAVH